MALLSLKQIIRCMQDLVGKGVVCRVYKKTSMGFLTFLLSNDLILHLTKAFVNRADSILITL